MRTMYKVTATGAMSEWRISGKLDTAEITIQYGQHHGAMQTQLHTVETNNSGRSLKEQMLLEIKSRISKQRAKGYRNTIEEARENINKNELNLHKPMLAQRYDKVKNIDVEGAFRQYKYDGHRCLMTCQDGEIIAYSRNGKLIETLDHIKIGMEIPEGTTIDGEIYCHGYQLQTIASWCKRYQTDTLRLKYMVYDIITNEPYEQRLDRLRSMELGPNSIIAETWRDAQSPKHDLRLAIKEGYEGLILRCGQDGYDIGKRSKSLIKVKEVLDDEFQVVDITASADGWAVLTCKVKDDKTFRVSAPGTIDNKRSILRDKQSYIGQWINVEFFSETKDGIPFHPVATFWRDKNAE